MSVDVWLSIDTHAIAAMIVASCRIFLLLTLFLGLSVINYSTTYEITITYSVCVQYSYATVTVDLILMAVDQKD